METIGYRGYSGYIGVIKGIYRGYIGVIRIMENQMVKKLKIKWKLGV